MRIIKLIFVFFWFFWFVFLSGYGTSPPVTQYETHYVTAHKGPVTAAAFTPDGKHFLFSLLSLCCDG